MSQKAGIKGLRYRVDGKGTVFFILPNGSTNRDNGKEIHFSVHDDQAKTLAENLTQAKWGHNIQLDGWLFDTESAANASAYAST